PSSPKCEGAPAEPTPSSSPWNYQRFLLGIARDFAWNFTRNMSSLANRCINSRHLTLLLAFAFLTGCQTATYRAERLPPEFRAASTASSQIINLAQIAAPGTSSAILAPGDLLEITVATGREDEKTNPFLARVADDGTVDVPVIGPVPVAGLEEFDAGQSIADLAIQRGMYRHPLVTLEIKAKAVNRITVLGAVQDPGVHELPRGGCDLVAALAAAGGLDDTAGTEVEIIRQPKFGLAAQESPAPSAPDTDSSEIQLAAYQHIGRSSDAPAGNQQHPRWLGSPTIRIDLAQANLVSSPDFRLGDRDIVRVVPRKQKMIYVTGLVNQPGQFELPVDQDVHLLDALALAGGLSSPVADKILVLRHFEDRPQPLVIQASLAKAKKNGLENLRLTAGDTVTVEQTPATAVVDTLFNFFRMSFGFSTRALF
ncbi:MAG: SLBB domain-containing protein, partial [Pirellulales bacterium]|nr:SLBB domain-containing protein [Pirellulales bacterium]